MYASDRKSYQVRRSIGRRQPLVIQYSSSTRTRRWMVSFQWLIFVFCTNAYATNNEGAWRVSNMPNVNHRRSRHEDVGWTKFINHDATSRISIVTTNGVRMFKWGVRYDIVGPGPSLKLEGACAPLPAWLRLRTIYKYSYTTAINLCAFAVGFHRLR